jgi:hypothetical protein
VRRRRLDAAQAAAVAARARPVDRPGPSGTVPADLVGTDLLGRAVHERLVGDAAAPWTLLVFLSGTCQGCEDLWSLIAPGALPSEALAAGARCVAVVREVGEEERRLMAERAPDGGVVVVSDEAWRAFAVFGPPFFAVVRRHPASVETEGVAWGRADVLGHLLAALAGRPSVEVPRLTPAPPQR